jgi:putative SOS response-associated peptidase YedK
MPVILQPADYAAWLSAQTKAEDLKALLKPLPGDLMECYRVSRRMGNTRNEGEECIAPWGGD